MRPILTSNLIINKYLLRREIQIRTGPLKDKVMENRSDKHLTKVFIIMGLKVL